MMGHQSFLDVRTRSKIFLSILCSLASVASEPVVTAPSGTFQGKELTGANNLPYIAFRGIPFAEPPVGDLRFRQPVQKAKLGGVYDATEFKSPCVQFNPISDNLPIGEEDCLYLNVFAPVGSLEKQETLKKVYFYIHGGGNMNGWTSAYHPGSLVSYEDIIVVTTAYRLAFLGFLTTESPACPGNLGLWDQVEALRWVRENIRAFGGDPEAVTISGESAGGMNTGALSFSPKAKDLFSQAYPMSGVLSPGPFSLVTQNPKTVTFQIARREKCLEPDHPDPESEAQIEQMLECLRRVPHHHFSSGEGLDPLPNIGLVIDGELLPKPLVELNADKEFMESIHFNKKKYMVGFVSNEGVLFDIINDIVLSKMPEDERKDLPPNAMFFGFVQHFLSVVFGSVSQEVINKVAEYYMNNYEVSPNADFSADVVFHLPSLEYANASSTAYAPGESQVFLFRFVNFPKFLVGKVQGTAHGLDQAYLFDLDFEEMKKIIDYGVDETKWNEEDDATKRKYCALVGAFVKTGNPGSALADDLPGGWPAYDPESGKYLEFNLSPTVKSHFRSDASRLWKEQIPAWIQQFPVNTSAKDTGKEEL